MAQENLEDIYKELMEQNQPSTEVVNDPPEGAEETVSDSTEEVVEEVVEQTESVSEPPQEGVEEGTEETIDPEEDKVSDDGIFDDWYDDSTESTTDSSETTIEVDYSQIGKELGFEDISNKEELKSKIEAIKQPSEPDYSSLPPKIQQAIEMSKKGDDYERLFSQPEGYVDHTVYDDETLLKHEYSTIFKDAEGNVDMDSLEEYLGDMTDAQKRVNAVTIRRNLDNYNGTLIREQEAQIQQERQRADAELKEAVTKLDNVQGFKVSPNEKESLYSKIASGEAAKEMFYKDDGSYDMEKLSELYFLKRNFPKIKDFLVKMARNQTRKEEFENISNANPRGREMQTEVHNQEKPSAVDQWVDDLKSRNAGSFFRNE